MQKQADGRQGQKNIYLCAICGHGFVTIDRDNGVTPFMTACVRAGCHGPAQSLFYAAPQKMLEPIAPAFEWYRPSDVELTMRNSPAITEHVKKGGLISRRIEPAPAVPPATSTGARP